MRKIFTGNGEVTPYRPWTKERRAAAYAQRVIRAHGKVPKNYAILGNPKAEAWMLLMDAEVAQTGLSYEDAHDSLTERIRRANADTADGQRPD